MRLCLAHVIYFFDIALDSLGCMENEQLQKEMSSDSTLKRKAQLNINEFSNLIAQLSL